MNGRWDWEPGRENVRIGGCVNCGELHTGILWAFWCCGSYVEASMDVRLSWHGGVPPCRQRACGSLRLELLLYIHYQNRTSFFPQVPFFCMSEYQVRSSRPWALVHLLVLSTGSKFWIKSRWTRISPQVHGKGHWSSFVSSFSHSIALQELDSIAWWLPS